MDISKLPKIFRNEINLSLSPSTFVCATTKEGGVDVCDLSGATFQGTDLTAAKLSGAVLSGANLSYANLSGADLSKSYLVNATLNNLWETDFSGANLAGTNLCNSSLSGTINLDMTGALVCKSLFDGATQRTNGLTVSASGICQDSSCGTISPFTNQDLAGVNLNSFITPLNLNGANLTKAQLRKTTVTSAVFANLAGANLSQLVLGSDLSFAVVDTHTVLAGGLPASARGVCDNDSCSAPSFQSVMLLGANLTNYDFSGLDLTGTDLILQNSNLTGANFSGTNLTSVSLSGATGVDLTGAIVDAVATTLPSASNPAASGTCQNADCSNIL